MFETSLDLNIQNIFDSMNKGLDSLKADKGTKIKTKVFVKRVINIEKNVVNVELGPGS